MLPPFFSLVFFFCIIIYITILMPLYLEVKCFISVMRSSWSQPSGFFSAGRMFPEPGSSYNKVCGYDTPSLTFLNRSTSQTSGSATMPFKMINYWPLVSLPCALRKQSAPDINVRLTKKQLGHQCVSFHKRQLPEQSMDFRKKLTYLILCLCLIEHIWSIYVLSDF